MAGAAVASWSVRVLLRLGRFVRWSQWHASASCGVAAFVGCGNRGNTGNFTRPGRGEDCQIESSCMIPRRVVHGRFWLVK